MKTTQKHSDHCFCGQPGTHWIQEMLLWDYKDQPYQSWVCRMHFSQIMHLQREDYRQLKLPGFN
jgi:hypothetical protein